MAWKKKIVMIAAPVVIAVCVSAYLVSRAIIGSSQSVWVSVPGNSTFGTHDFLLMKYDVSCTKAGKVLTAPLEETNGYDNANDVAPDDSCTPANGKQIASLPDAPPIVEESQTEAENYCASIGAHLITNAEWQTVAWNAEEVGSNWSGGAPGKGYMYSGHNDIMPRTALPASADDSQGYYDEVNKGGNQRRTLTLSNGSVVWDMAGNIWQWTSDTIRGEDEPHTSSTGLPVWNEFPAITNWGALSQQMSGPVDSSWDSTKGVGEIYSDEKSTDTLDYGFLRGGTMDYLETAGIESLGLFNTPDNIFDAIGFRCAK
jgi:formylglycine-generating enzyme required for sulfatase activity